MPSLRSSTWPTLRRRSLLALAVGGVAALAAGCASKPEIRSDRDARADFSAYKTFAFHDELQARGTRGPRDLRDLRDLRDGREGAPPQRGGAGGSYTTLQEARLKQATREQLERLGYALAQGEPDLRVHLMMKVARQQELRSTPGAPRAAGYRGFGWNSTQLDTVDVRQGTLVIDLVDAKRNALVWRGVAEGRIDSDAAQDPGPAIERVVAEVFATFKR